METIETLSTDLRILKSSLQRQRIVIASLAAVIGIGAFIGATRPAGDATFDTITCKKWLVVDKDGKVRIGSTVFDDGEASVQWYDKDGKKRINAGTFADRQAAVFWTDKDGKTRIVAATSADGTVELPTKDLNVVFATDPKNDRDTIRKPLQKTIDSCAILDYNGVKYQLADGDIPGLEGCGVIMLQVMGGMSQSSSSGFTRGQCSISHRNGRTFVNNVDIAELVERLKNR